MKLFRFRGGVHPKGRKEATAYRPIQPLPLPERLYLPMQQHIGNPAEPIVRPGQRIGKGELLARAQGPVSAPVHAPTSGQVAAITDHTAPHPSGLPVLTVIIEPDGEDRWVESNAPEDPFSLAPEDVTTRVGAAGIVGMGGATFPSAVKLGLRRSAPIHTLIINGGECEPYLTCDDRLMRERAPEVVDGIRIMAYALECEHVLIAVESNKPQAAAAMRVASLSHAAITVVVVPTRYPMGSEKQLIRTLTGREVPAGGLSSDLGVVVHNVGTAYAVHHAVRHGRPLVSRVVTVSGGAVRKPHNLEVPIGAPVSALIEACGGLSDPPARLLMGGPMMGQTLPSKRVPVVKGTSGIIALAAAEVRQTKPGPCIRCARCVQACPIGLVPLEIASRIGHFDLNGALDWGLIDCIACGSCAYVCPAGIPLVQYFNFAKGELAARQQAEHKANETRKLAVARAARLERIRQEKLAAAKRRKAERAAKQSAQKQGKPTEAAA
jgi:electron transport complex protein RnfC